MWSVRPVASRRLDQMDGINQTDAEFSPELFCCEPWEASAPWSVHWLN